MSIIKMFFGGIVFIGVASALTDSSKRIEQQVECLYAELNELKDKCESFESTVDDLESKLYDLESKIDDLDSKIDGVECDLIVNYKQI